MVSTVQRTIALLYKEEGVCKIFRQYGQVYPVELSFDTVGDYVSFPWIRPSVLIKSMCSTSDISLLLGGAPTFGEAKQALQLFWSRFQSIYPNHGVFRRIQESRGAISTSHLLPILVHGDEGTTYKRNGMLVLQFSGALGQGTRKSATPNEWYKDLASYGIPMNLVRTALQTRLLTLLCPKDGVGMHWFFHCVGPGRNQISGI